MNSRRNARRIGIVVLAIIVVAVAAGIFAYIKSTSDAPTPTTATSKKTQRVTVENGITVVKVDESTQAQSGIRTLELSGASQQPTTTAYATVLDLQPLLDLRARYLAAQADTSATTSAADASKKEYERNRALYQDDQNVSLKAFQASQATHFGDQAKMQAAITNTRNLRASMRQQFGEIIAAWAADPSSARFARLLDGQEVLLRVVLPLGAKMQPPAKIEIAPNNAERQPAYFVSPSTQSDPSIQGSAFLYRTNGLVATGTNVAAYLPTSSEDKRGVVIPGDAIVWHGGQPWAYVQTGQTQFARRAVGQQSPDGGGFFVTEGLKAGERVVVSGAQLLLSEELRPPPGGPACKDPECD